MGWSSCIFFAPCPSLSPWSPLPPYAFSFLYSTHSLSSSSTTVSSFPTLSCLLPPWSLWTAPYPLSTNQTSAFPFQLLSIPLLFHLCLNCLHAMIILALSLHLTWIILSSSVFPLSLSACASSSFPPFHFLLYPVLPDSPNYSHVCILACFVIWDFLL